MLLVRFVVLIEGVLGAMVAGRPWAGPDIQITEAPSPADMVLVDREHVVQILVDPNEDHAVHRAAMDLVEDVYRVTGRRPELLGAMPPRAEGLVIIGTAQNGQTIKHLGQLGRLDLGRIADASEAYLIQTLREPLDGIGMALVIAGSDRRGAIYGIYTISEAIGVSPWYWWADVPVKIRRVLAIRPLTYRQGPPAVRYRGIFINDEDFGLRPWAARTFDPDLGNIGPKTYAKVFELLLRLKGNLLWPAMHEGTVAFNRLEENRRIAEEFGVIIGSSHCEQMLRNNVDEWHRYGQGDYDYVTNRDGVLRYWEARVKEFARFEGIYTVGMRGIHDSGMPGGGTQQQQAARLHQIIADQRQLLARYVNQDLSKVPQMFCPYKEVLALYRLAPDIPADITICWPDDNWGYVRQFCDQQERARQGGAGVYYHLSYWGLPYDYLWLCSTPLALAWEELTKAYDYGARAIWVVNVGDIKPAEIGMEFILDMAWDPHRYGPGDLDRYLKGRFARDFGQPWAEEMASIMEEYYRLCLQRRPEHMGIDPRNRLLADPGFSVMLNGDEAQARLDAFEHLAERVDALEHQLPAEYRDAFFQLVAYPVKAAASMNEKGLCLARFKVYSSQGRACAARYLAQAVDAYRRIQELTDIYNHRIAGGKWRGMMSAAPRNLPVFAFPSGHVQPVPQGTILGVAVEGDERAVTGKDPNVVLSLPRFSRFTRRRYFIDVFAVGTDSTPWQARPSDRWILIEPNSAEGDRRLIVDIDWAVAPQGQDVKGSITIVSGGQQVDVQVRLFNPTDAAPAECADFVEDDGLIVIEAEHTSSNRPGRDAIWQEIEGLGYNGKAMCTQPFTAGICDKPSEIATSSPSLEYKVWIWQAGRWSVIIRALPTFSVQAGMPQRVAVAFDDALPQIVSLPLCLTEQDPNWQQGVLRNMAFATSIHQLDRPGPHLLRIWMVDPGIVIDSIVACIGPRPRLGYTLPPETMCKVRD